MRTATEIRYGRDESLRLELAPESLLALCAAPRGEPLADVGAALARSLAEPLGFPPLVQAALPGDKVVLAVAPGVPRAATIVAGTIQALCAGGVSTSDITVLYTPAELDAVGAGPLEELPTTIRQQITTSIHDSTSRNSLGYLAANAQAKPVYINRAIHDADLVISIGCLRLDDAPGYFGAGSSLFPTFSDTAAIERFRAPNTSEPAVRQRLRKEADEVTWLLGLPFTIQVVPGAGEEVLHVLGGELKAVAQAGSELCEQAWSYPVPRRAELVVATIEGGAVEQTWEKIGQAAAAAAQCVSEGGAIALCTELDLRPGPALQHMIGSEDLDTAFQEISHHRPADALAAMQLASAVQNGPVFFLSRLPDDVVEELGIVPVACDQLSRLAARYESCIVLGNAQYAIARPRHEDAPVEPLARRKAR